MANSFRKNGFTLIELSIALVIIGLIIGGILAGKELIRTAELRNTLSKEQSFEQAIATFKLKYNCLPGDCARGTQFFDNSENGNGDGKVQGTDHAGSAPNDYCYATP